MSVATHRAAIVAMLATVADIGQVHDHEPVGRTEVKFREFYAWTPDDGQTQLRGWFVQRTRTTELQASLGRMVNVHGWRVRGFMAIDEDGATELAFDALIEAVRKRYRNDPTLAGAVEPGPTPAQVGMQLTDATSVVLAGVLCHSATLTFATTEYLDDGE